MLKIKDSVDLKELEKFGLKPRYNTYTGEIEKYEKITNINSCLCNSKEEISIEIIKSVHNWGQYDSRYIWKIYKYDDIDLIFDLIKADLVEKV